MIKIQKPFIKWVGGKTQIIDKIIDKIDSNINNYHEIFLGGGSVLFSVLSLYKHGKIKIKGKIYAYDINRSLINVYNHVKNDRDVLFGYLCNYFNEYNQITDNNITRNASTLIEAKTSRESYYYWIRRIFNTIDRDSIEASALFIFLNKTCFRGIFREGPNGFNVPYGNYKNITIIPKDELDSISSLISDVEFINMDYIDSIKNIKDGDFVYLDPPYVPVNKNSFVGYTKDGFNLNNHKTLFDEIVKFNNRNIKFVMSNTKVELVIDYFKNYKCEDIEARRAINSKNPESKTMEVIISN